jgi:N-dimethylarginine dimethylaminohydrolase
MPTPSGRFRNWSNVVFTTDDGFTTRVNVVLTPNA